MVHAAYFFLIFAVPGPIFGEVFCKIGDEYLLEEDGYTTRSCSVTHAGGAYAEGPVERINNKNGRVVFRSSFSKGELNGDYRVWYDSGAKNVEGAFRFGNKDGKWVYYSESGSVVKVENYNNGVLIR
jgi:hypothetical protein